MNSRHSYMSYMGGINLLIMEKPLEDFPFTVVNSNEADPNQALIDMQSLQRVYQEVGWQVKLALHPKLGFGLTFNSPLKKS